MGCCDSDDEGETNRERTEPRGCTDIFWLCLYIAFLSLMVIIAAFSFVYGNPIRIVNGYDSFGNTCGTRHNKRIGNLELSGIDTSDKPYLIFYNLKELRRSLKICVRECPKQTISRIDDLYTYYQQTGNNLCKYDFDYSDFQNYRIPDKSSLGSTFGPCPVTPIYESIPVLNRCVPRLLKDATAGFLDSVKGVYDLLNNWDTLEQILRDVYTTWTEILLLTFLAFVLSIVTMAMLHLLASLVSYLIMILVSVASIGGTAFLWYTYYDIKNNLNSRATNQFTILTESLRNETAFFWYSIIATVITVIILILVIVMRKRVDFLADLFKETSKCLFHIPGLFLQPVFTFIILVAFFALWIFVVLCLATAYHPDTSDIAPTAETIKTGLTTVGPNVGILERVGNISLDSFKKFTAVEYLDATWVKYMWWVYFIGLIWTSEFIMGCQQMVIAGAVAHWYYRHKYNHNSHVLYAIGKLIKYHLGSVALGSLVITVFKIPRLIMTFIHARLQQQTDKGSECAKCMLKCCICCFYCLEKFLRYLNHNAYTVIAIDGSNFCTAAATAFQVLASNALQVATINSVGDFILFLGKCLVTAVTGIVGLSLFRVNPNLTFYAAPTMVVCIFAFFVAHCLLSLYEMVLDTVYLCMCQSGEPPEGLQMQNLGITNNGNTAASVAHNPEMQPMK